MPFKGTFTPNPEEIKAACRKPLHPEAERGLLLYNQGKYFIAHEALENAWHAEPEPDRRLYQGILQAGIAFMHARNGYVKGVFSMYERCVRWLEPWPDHCRCINISKLRHDLKALVVQVSVLGEYRIHKIDPKLFTLIERVG